MADNTTINAGTAGDVIATDDIGGVKFQRVKLIHGADGVNAGDVATGNPLPAREARGATATRTESTATSDALVLAANASRIRVVFYNNGDKDFLLGCGTAAVTTSNFTIKLVPGSAYGEDDYSGEIRGFFVSALGSGALKITEIA